MSLYFQGWCRIQTPFNCTRHLIAINRGRSPRPIVVVVVINATVSFTSVYILHAAKTTVLLQGTIANKVFFFFWKPFLFEKQNDILSYSCITRSLYRLKNFVFSFFPIHIQKELAYTYLYQSSFLCRNFFPVHDLKPDALHCWKPLFVTKIIYNSSIYYKFQNGFKMILYGHAFLWWIDLKRQTFSW